MPSARKAYKKCFGGGLSFKIFDWSKFKIIFRVFSDSSEEGWKNGVGL